MKDKVIKINRDPFNVLLEGIGDVSKYLESFKDIEYPYYRASKTVGHVNMSSDESEYSIEVSAPGFKKEDLSIDIKDSILTIKGEQTVENEEVEKKYSRREFKKSSFTRSFTLPENISGEVDAKFENGILNIQLKKKVLPPVEESKRIEIK